MNRKRMLKDTVVAMLSNMNDIDESSIDSLIDDVRKLPILAEISEEDVDEVREALLSQYSIVLSQGALIEESGHEKWFLARKADINMRYWERYKTYLLRDKNFSVNVVNTMDNVLDTLTDLLGDPVRDIMYSRRGLIIGDIQSGKTANYIGLICKAVDAGYKVVILLTGMIEQLRQQTQRRVDEGFVGSSSDSVIKQREDGIKIGVGCYDDSVRPMVLTSVQDDFKQQNARNLNFDLRNINGPVIFVVKKNAAVLKRLNKWLKTFNKTGDNPINNSLLLIDDEADNASINTKTEDNPTTINGQIRDLQNMFTKSSYVGFTATPFANIFIDPDSYNDMVAEDLFPKDYVYSLNAPSNYIGARDIFNANGKARNMLETINDDETDPNSIAYILPAKHKSYTVITRLPKDLKEAVAAFIIANTLEDLRGMKGNHRSMLINISRFTGVQNNIADLVDEYLKVLKNSIRLYASLPVEKAMQDGNIEKLYSVKQKIYPDIDIEWSKIQEHLYRSSASIEVQTVNQSNDDKLTYDEYKDGRRVIAVGGLSLSRGLTLEGLVVSYFYRNSRMYDTLMQMGRWFGYRDGYSDLCRIWMSATSISWYEHISRATDELREEVKHYEDSGLTPLDFGLRVRSDINSLIVTARNKMSAGTSREWLVSLSGECIETPEIFSDEEKNSENLDIIRDFTEELYRSGFNSADYGNGRKERIGFINIPKEYILDFLNQIEVSPKNEQFNIPAIIRFIREYQGSELEEWDIAFASGSSARSIKINDKININPMLRNYSIENDGKILKMSGSKRRLGTTSDGIYGLTDDQIKAVKEARKPKAPSQKDYFNIADRKPLLTVYIVEAKAKHDISENYKENNEYDGRILTGFGIGIPLLSNQNTKFAKYVLNKVAIQNIFEGETEDWDDEE